MIGWYVAAGVAVLLALLLFLIAPAMGRKDKRRAVLVGHYAHRGLFDNQAGIPENSMAAFRRAVERGYGIETDIHLSADGICVLHHDDTLKRICGVDGNLRDRTAEELSKLSLLGTEETVPLFSEFLRLVDGKVPLVLELKAEGNHAALVAQVMADLEGYKGSYCIESFDPRILRELRRQAPHVVRGQLSGGLSKDSAAPLTRFLLRNLWLNVIARPDFVAYCYKDRKNPFFRFVTSVMGATRVYWTLRDRADHEAALRDRALSIFEGFEA